MYAIRSYYVNNGIKYTPGNGSVEIRLAIEDTEAVLAVADSGIGIAVEHQPHIFERFYRVDEAQRMLAAFDAAEGSGILRIGAGSGACEYLLPSLLARLYVITSYSIHYTKLYESVS